MVSVYVGTAAWALPREEQHRFPESGTHLQRYATRFTAVEINSTFYRPHRRSTFERWAESVPDEFRFALKVPKVITHERRLRDTEPALDEFLEMIGGLGSKLGCLLVQLPPSFVYDMDIVGSFFEAVRERTNVDVACEPRHKSWASEQADDRLTHLKIARVVADPLRVPGAEEPGGCTDIVYYRLHGSPQVYWSSYSEEFLESMAHRLEEDRADGRRAWCIFDNTARNAATGNGLFLLERLERGPQA